MDIAATPWCTVFVGRRNKPGKPGFCFTLHSEQHLVNRGRPVNPYLSFDQLIMLTIKVSELRVYKEYDTTWQHVTTVHHVTTSRRPSVYLYQYLKHISRE